MHHNAANPRVFGSVLHGDDTDDSDLDLLVDPAPGLSLMDLAAIEVEAQTLLGVRVDVRTLGDLPPSFRDRVAREALPV
jgi:predicted nucleotidyltransferase